MTFRQGGTSWRGPVQIRIWKVGPTSLAICQNKPPMSTSSFSLFSSSPPPPAIFNFADRYSQLRKKLRVPRFERKNFANNRTKKRGKAFHIGSRDSRGFVFRIGGERELDGRGVFQYLRRCFEQLRMKFVALLVENKGECFEEWFIFGCNVHFYSYR